MTPIQCRVTLFSTHWRRPNMNQFEHYVFVFRGVMVIAAGFEPATAGLEIPCSIQLSYAT